MCIVFEDDLVCVPGTYEYLCSALHSYRKEERVMSVSGWTHPQITPKDVTDQPYFDGRADCWVWGTWARSWAGMESDALTLLNRCRDMGINPYGYGADLVRMAQQEKKKNIWAVRMLYNHMVKGGLCLRPPWSMVEHIGFDAEATNAGNGDVWHNPPLKKCPPIPKEWPAIKEHPQCRSIWQKVCGCNAHSKSRLARLLLKIVRKAKILVNGDD
jgi:hypothetical protein